MHTERHRQRHRNRKRRICVHLTSTQTQTQRGTHLQDLFNTVCAVVHVDRRLVAWRCLQLCGGQRREAGERPKGVVPHRPQVVGILTSRLAVVGCRMGHAPTCAQHRHSHNDRKRGFSSLNLGISVRLFVSSYCGTAAPKGSNELHAHAHAPPQLSRRCARTEQYKCVQDRPSNIWQAHAMVRTHTSGVNTLATRPAHSPPTPGRHTKGLHPQH